MKTPLLLLLLIIPLTCSAERPEPITPGEIFDAVIEVRSLKELVERFDTPPTLSFEKHGKIAENLKGHNFLKMEPRSSGVSNYVLWQTKANGETAYTGAGLRNGILVFLHVYYTDG